jgi:hypothetical protein
MIIQLDVNWHPCLILGNVDLKTCKLYFLIPTPPLLVYFCCPVFMYIVLNSKKYDNDVVHQYSFPFTHILTFAFTSHSCCIFNWHHFSSSWSISLNISSTTNLLVKNSLLSLVWKYLYSSCIWISNLVVFFFQSFESSCIWAPLVAIEKSAVGLNVLPFRAIQGISLALLSRMSMHRF